jgi:hypothetical protein
MTSSCGNPSVKASGSVRIGSSRVSHSPCSSRRGRRSSRRSSEISSRGGKEREDRMDQNLPVAAGERHLHQIEVGRVECPEQRRQAEVAIHGVLLASPPQAQHQQPGRRDQQRHALVEGDAQKVQPLVVGAQLALRSDEGWIEAVLRVAEGVQPQMEVVVAGAQCIPWQQKQQRTVPVARQRLIEAAAIADQNAVEVDRHVHAEPWQVDGLGQRFIARPVEIEAVPADPADAIAALGPDVGQWLRLPGGIVRWRLLRITEQKTSLAQLQRLRPARLQGQQQPAAQQQTEGRPSFQKAWACGVSGVHAVVTTALSIRWLIA